jgi:hypothetical protein
MISRINAQQVGPICSSTGERESRKNQYRTMALFQCKYSPTKTHKNFVLSKIIDCSMLALCPPCCALNNTEKEHHKVL